MEVLLYFGAGLILGIVIMLLRPLLQGGASGLPTERRQKTRNLKKQISLLRDQIVTQQEDYETHIENMKSERQNQYQALLNLLTDIEELIQRQENNALSQNSMDALEGVTDKLKKEVDALLDLVTTFKRWHEGLTELRANNKLMHKLNNEFKAVGSQTVTLSLNASIEASKSGEIGKGFKVVAQEISSLAQQTQELCNNYAKELHKNDLLTTTAFQDTQAGSRMILNAVDGLLYLTGDLQREVSQILKSNKDSQLGKLVERLEDLQKQIKMPSKEFK